MKTKTIRAPEGMRLLQLGEPIIQGDMVRGLGDDWEFVDPNYNSTVSPGFVGFFATSTKRKRRPRKPQPTAEQVLRWLEKQKADLTSNFKGRSWVWTVKTEFEWHVGRTIRQAVAKAMANRQG